MNDFSEIEAELKKLRPSDVSPELAARIAAALDQDAPRTQAAGVIKHRRGMQWNWLPLGLGIATAAAFLLLARLNLDRPSKSPRTVAAVTSPVPAATSRAQGMFVPEGLTQVVYNTRDEGLHFAPNASTPMRRVRSRQRETLRWQNPETGASLRVSYPTEEVTLTPISGQ